MTEAEALNTIETNSANWDLADMDSQLGGALRLTTEGIFGAPYQFMESVDARVENASMGTTFMEKIITRMPLLLIAPGKSDFMSGTGEAEKENTIMSLLSAFVEEDDSQLEGVNSSLGSSNRYFTHKSDMVAYYEKVDAMLTTGCSFLGLNNVKIPKPDGSTTTLEYYRWSNYSDGYLQDPDAEGLSGSFKSLISGHNPYVAFYVDSASEASESFTNTTTQSAIAGAINGTSALTKEAAFILGQNNVVENLGELIDDVGGVIDDAASSLLDAFHLTDGSSLIKNLTSNFSTIAAGGKLQFPDIWDDSQFDRGYDITIKLRTPDADILSWYFNIYAPLCHLICLAAPAQDDSHPNGYLSPPIVKAFHKGLFNCNLGMVTNLQITKGRESAWTLNGLPTEIDISMTITELYKAMSTTGIKQHFYNNIDLMDYIANTCAININEPDLERMASLVYLAKKKNIVSIPGSFYDQLQQDIYNGLNGFESRFLNTLVKI